MKRPPVPLLLILALYLVITLAYSVVNPLFEAPDEHWHYFTAQYIADTKRLPFIAQGAAYDEWLSQEAAQPPLYYWLAAQIIRPIVTENPRQTVRLNPFFPQGIGNAAAPANRNAAVHTPAEAWPWREYALAAHLLRGLSALLGLGTLLSIYGSGRLLWPNEPQRALLAVSLAAFLPQFNFVHSAIGNDPLIIFLSSLAVWQLLRLWVTAVSPSRLLILGSAIGLAALTKNTGVLLGLYALSILILLALRDSYTMIEDQRLKISRYFQSLIINLLLVILPVLLIAGWLWRRNWTLYGDWTAANQFIQIAGGDRAYTLWQVWGESSGLWLSLIAVFGWFNVRAPNWIYWLWDGVTLLAVSGGIWKIKDLRLKINRPNHQSSIINLQSSIINLQSLILNLQPSLWLAGWPLAVYAGLLMFMLKTEAAQGRLLFPAIVPLALGLAYGLSQLPITDYQLPKIVWPSLGLATTLFSLIFVIPPVYARPPIVAEIPDSAALIGAEMGQQAQLLGAQVETATAVPGNSIWFTLYWQAESPLDTPPEIVLELFGRETEGDLPVVGKLHSYHGRGLYPADLWPSGAIVADRFAVRLDEALAAPVLARAFVHLAGEETAVDVGAVKIIPAAWPPPAGDALAEVGEGVALTAASLAATTAHPGDEVDIQVQWLVTAAPAADYTTLIHLALPGQPPLAVGDRPPLNGQYPTHVWEVGEVIDDAYTLTVPLDLPDGRYPIWIGSYDPATMIRQPVQVNGRRQPNDVYQIGELVIQ